VYPDLEVGTLLTARGSAPVAANGGSVEYRPGGNGAATTVALLTEFVRNQGSLFGYTVDELRGYFERAAADPGREDVGSLGAAALLEASAEEPPNDVVAAIDTFLETARLAGSRTGELHVALASAVDDPAFAPEPFSELYQRSLYQSIGGTARRTIDLLARRADSLPAAAVEEAARVIERRGAVDLHLRGLLAHKFGGMRTRTHGDLHGEQILYTGRDLVFIDFEGEPTRPLSERRLKRSPLRDVAGMLRSFSYASLGSLLRPEMGGDIRPEDMPGLDGWVRAWYRWVGASYLAGYREATAGSEFLPSDDGEWATLLDAFLLEKAFYELHYELNNRPDWVAIPLRGILQSFEG
jgi:maltose alpha-D-glucosyltransferase/alpha-amylase